MKEIVSRGQHFEVEYHDRSFGGAVATVLKIDGDNVGAFDIEAPVNFGADVDYDAAQTFTVKATVAVAAKKCVTILGALADNTDNTHPAVGISVLGAASGAPCVAVTKGVAKGVLTSATPGVRYYLSTTGDLTTTRTATTGHAIMSMGYAITATDLYVQIADQGVAP